MSNCSFFCSQCFANFVENDNQTMKSVKLLCWLGQSRSGPIVFFNIIVQIVSNHFLWIVSAIYQHKRHFFSFIQLMSIHWKKQFHKSWPCFGSNCPDPFVSRKIHKATMLTNVANMFRHWNQFCKSSRIIVPVWQTNEETPRADPNIISWTLVLCAAWNDACQGNQQGWDKMKGKVKTTTNKLPNPICAQCSVWTQNQTKSQHVHH